MTSKEPVTFQSANKRFLSIASISGLFYIRNPLVKLLFSKISSFLFTFTFSLLFTLVFNFIYSSVRGSRLGQLTDQIRLRTQTISVGGISCKQESCSTKSVDRRRGSWIELRRLFELEKESNHRIPMEPHEAHRWKAFGLLDQRCVHRFPQSHYQLVIRLILQLENQQG